MARGLAGVMMGINMYILERELRLVHGEAIKSSLSAPELENQLRFCSLYDAEETLRTDTLYIAEFDQVTSIMQSADASSSSIVFVGEPRESAGLSNWLSVPRNWSTQHVFNAVLAIFVRYQKWEDDLAALIEGNSTVGDLIEASVPIFSNTILVHDSDFRIIAAKAPSGAPDIKSFYSTLSETGAFPENFLEAFTDQRDFLESMNDTDPGFWYDRAFESASSYINVCITDNYYLRICVDSTMSPQYSGDLVKLKVLAAYVKKLYTQLPVGQVGQTPDLDGSLMAILDGAYVDEEDIVQRMHWRGWSHEDVFICAKVVVGGGVFDAYRLKSICDRFLGIYSDSCTFAYKGHVVIVENLTRSNLLEREFVAHLSESLRENALCGGVSNAFGEIFSLDKMYRQADIALSYADEKNAECLSVFENVALNYLIDSANGDLAVEYIVPRPLFLLMDYDKHHKSNLVDTLRVVLDNKANFTKCCEELFIHRSTLSYRIERIEAITGADFDDAETRLYYQIALRMLNRRKGVVGAYAKAHRVYRFAVRHD